MLIYRLHQRTVVTNGQLESEPECNYFTNGVCDRHEVSLPVPAGSIAQQHTVPSSQKLPSSTHNIDLLSNAVLQDGQSVTSDGSDVVSGNYLSSGDDLVPSSPALTSLSSEEAMQKPFSVDITLTSDETQALAMQPVVSCGETVESHAAAAAEYVTNGAVMDTKQAVTSTEESKVLKFDEAVCDKQDTTSVEVSDGKTPSDKEAKVYAMTDSSESVTNSDRTGISNLQVGDCTETGLFSTDKFQKPTFPAAEPAVNDDIHKLSHDRHYSQDATQEMPSAVSTKKVAQHPEESTATDRHSVTIDKTGNHAFTADEPATDNDDRYDGRDSKGSSQKLLSTVSTNETAQLSEETASDDLNAVLSDTVVAESKSHVKPSAVASTKHDMSSLNEEIPRVAVGEVDQAVLMPGSVSAGDYADVSDGGLRTEPSSDISKELEDMSMRGSDQTDIQQDADVGKVTERDAEGDRTVPQHTVAGVLPLSMDGEPRKPLPSDDASDVSHDQGQSKEAGIMPNDRTADVDNIVDSDESDLSRTRDEGHSSVELPKCDHDVEDEDEGYDVGHHDDMDKTDSEADDVDDDTTSSQVAPRSVKMHETAKSKQSGSTTSTVVCARPSRRQGVRTSETPFAGDVPEPVDSTEIPGDDESDKTKETGERLEHVIIVDGEEQRLTDSADEKSPRSEHVDEVDQTPAVGFTDRDQSDVTDEQHPPAGHGRTPEDVSLKEPVVHSPTSAVKIVSSHDAVCDIGVRPETVTEHSDGTDQATEVGRSDTAMAVKDSESVAVRFEEKTLDLKPSDTETVQGDRLHPSEEMADEMTSALPRKVTGRASDLQGSPVDKTGDDLPTLPKQNLTDQGGSGRIEPQEVDDRSTDAELAVLRPLEIWQRVEADEDKKYGAYERFQGTAAAGDDINMSNDKADDTGSRSVTKAIKTGALAIVAAPYIAGKAIAGALRSDTSPTTGEPLSQTRSDQHLRETTETSKDQQRKPLEDNGAAAVGTHIAEDRLHFSALPIQPNKDTEQKLDSASGGHGDASNMAKSTVSLAEPMTADVILNTSASLYQTSGTSEISAQQLLAEQASTRAGYKEPASSEIHNDRSAQLSVKLEPVLPVMESTKPSSEITATSTVPSAVSCQPLTSTLDSASLTDASSPSSETVQPVVSTTASTVPLSETVLPVLSTKASTVPSSEAVQPVVSTTALSVPLPETVLPASTVPSSVTVQPVVSTTASSVPSSETVLPALTVPSSEAVQPVVSTKALTVLSSKTVQPVVSTTVLTAPSSEAAQPVLSTVPSSALSSELSLPVVPATTLTVLSSEAAQPVVSTTASTLSSEAVQPIVPTTPSTMLSSDVVQHVVSTVPSTTLSSEASTAPSSESVQPVVSTVPTTQPLTVTTQSVLLVLESSQASPQTTVSVISALPAIALSQTTASTVISSSTTTSVTSLVTSTVFSDEFDVTAHVKPASEPPESSQAHEDTVIEGMPSEQTDKLLVDSSAVTAPAVEPQVLLDEQRKAEDGDKTRGSQPEQHVITVDELDDRNQSRSGFPVERSQPENKQRDPGLSSVAGSVKTAVKTGLLGIVGAPVLAGMAIAKAVKSKTEEGQDTQTTRSRETYAEPDSTKLQTLIAPSGQPSDDHSASAFVALSDMHSSQKYADTQAAFQTEEFQPQVSVSSRDVVADRWKEHDADKEVKGKSETDIHPPIATDEMQNDFGRNIESTCLPGLSLSEALLSRLYDQQHNCFIEPATGRRISLASAIQLGLIDGNNKVIADLSSGEVISVVEALHRGIIDPETGMVSVDGEAVVPLNEALASGLIMDDADGELLEIAASIGSAGGRVWNEATDVANSVEGAQKSAKSHRRRLARQPSQALKLVQVLDLGLYDPVSGEFRDPQSSDSLSLADAIRWRLLDKNSVVINDPQSEEVLSLEESIRGGLVSGSTSLVHDTSTSENIPLTEALSRGILVPRPMSIATAINIGLYDEANGMFFDPTNGLYFALEEAVEGGLIDPHSLVIDPATGKAMAVAAALACGILDARHGNVVNIHTGEVIPLKQMAVSSQAILGNQPVGVSSQITAASAAAEQGGTPDSGPDVHKISGSRILSSSGSSDDVLVTAGGVIETQDVREDDQLALVSPKHDISKTGQITDVANAAAEVPDTSSDVLKGEDLSHESLYQYTDHIRSSADIPADVQPSTGDQMNNVVDPASIHTGKSRHADSGQVQAVLPDHQPPSTVAEAAAGEVILPPDSSEATAGDKPLMTTVGDELSQEIRSHSAVDGSLPVSVSTSLTDQTAYKPFVSDDSRLPISAPVSATTTSLNISHEFHPSVVTVIREDGGKTSSAVDGISSTVSLQQILSSTTAVGVSDTQVEDGGVSSADSARDAELQQSADVEFVHDVGDVSGAENTEAATGQLPDNIHVRVGLEHLTQVEFTAAQAHGFGLPQAAAGPHDIQQVSETRRIEVKPIPGDVMSLDDGKTAHEDKAGVSKADRKKVDEMKYDSKNDAQNVDVQQLISVVQVDAKSDIVRKDEAKRDEVDEGDSEKDSSEKDVPDAQRNTPDVDEDVTQLSVVKPLPSTVTRKGGPEGDNVVNKGMEDKDVMMADDKQKVLTNVTESGDGVQQLSAVIEVDVISPSAEVEEKHSMEKDKAENEDLSAVYLKKDISQKETQKDAERGVELHHDDGVATIAGDVSKKDYVIEDVDGEDDVTKEGTRKDAAHNESHDDARVSGSIMQIETKLLPSGVVKKDDWTRDIVSETDSKKAVVKEVAAHVTESKEDVEELSKILQIEVKSVPEDAVRKGDGMSGDDGKKDKMKEDIGDAFKSQDMVAVTEEYRDDTASAQEDIADFERKPSDAVDAVKHQERHVDTEDIDKQVGDVIALETQQQQQKKKMMIVGSEVLAEENVLAAKGDGDTFATGKDDGIGLQKEDLTTDRDMPVPVPAVVEVSSECCYCVVSTVVLGVDCHSLFVLLVFSLQ